MQCDLHTCLVYSSQLSVNRFYFPHFMDMETEVHGGKVIR